MYQVDVGEPIKQIINEVSGRIQQNDSSGVASLLEGMTRKPQMIMDALPKFDVDEVLIYVDDVVTVYYIATTPGILYPPHEHGMVAISALYKGTETHVFYDPDGDNVIERSRVTFEAPAVVNMDIDCIHAICTSDGEPNQGLHFYFGDLENQQRRLWDGEGKNPQQYVQQVYLDRARDFD